MLVLNLISILSFVYWVSLTSVSAQTINLSGPAEISNCTANVFTWTGGLAPFLFYSGIISGGSNLQPKLTETTARTYTHSGTWENGQRLYFMVTGQNGTGSSQLELTVKNCSPPARDNSSDSSPQVVQPPPTTTTTTTAPPIIAFTSSTLPPVQADPPASKSSVTATTVIISGTSVVITSDVSVAQPTSTSGAVFITRNTSSPLSVSRSSQSEASASSSTPSPTGSAVVPINTSTSSGPATNMAAIGGGVAAAVVIILGIFFVIIWRRRRQRRGQFSRVDLTEPFPHDHYLDKAPINQEAYHITPYSPVGNHPVPLLAPNFIPESTRSPAAGLIDIEHSDPHPATQISPHLKERKSSPITEAIPTANEASSSGPTHARTLFMSSFKNDDVDDTLPPDYDAAVRQSRVDLSDGSQPGK